MKSLAFVVVLLLTGQTGAPAVAGTWTAQFEGRMFVRLQLETAKGTLTGGLAIGDIEMDKTGALKKVGPLPRDLTPIFDVKQSGSVLTFSRRDTNSIDRFELRVLDEGRSELRLLLSDEDLKELTAEGVPTPRPIVLTRR